MSIAEPQPTVPQTRLNWFYVTPGCCLAALLVVETLLWLSDRFGWLPWHKGYAVLTAMALVAAVPLLLVVWYAISLLFRLRFQFSLRSLLALTIAVALPCSWLAVEMRRARMQKETVKEFVKLGGSVGYDYQFDMFGKSVASAQPPGPAWLRNRFGDDFFADVAAVIVDGPQVTNAGMKHLEELPQLKALGLSGPHITDDSLELLQGLPRLQMLNLSDTQITDAGLQRLNRLTQLTLLGLARTKVTGVGLEHLIGLTKLQTLDLGSFLVTDAGLEHLQGMDQLHVLILLNAQVTDAGLENIKRLKHLTLLELAGTQVTTKGVAKLQQALPNCKINTNGSIR